MSWKKKAITISALSALTTFTIHLANKIIDISATFENHEQNTAGSYFVGNLEIYIMKNMAKVSLFF